jgi:hypothetical protein
MKSKYDIRYCSNNQCPCHPETKIRRLLSNKELSQFLEEEHLYNTIIKIINETNESVTIFDKYNIQ